MYNSNLGNVDTPMCTLNSSILLKNKKINDIYYYILYYIFHFSILFFFTFDCLLDLNLK